MPTEWKCLEGDSEKAMELLRESMHCAREYDVRDSVHPREYAFTVSLLDKGTVDFRAVYHGDSKIASLIDTVKAMSWSEVLKPLRDREDFKSLLNKEGSPRH